MVEDKISCREVAQRLSLASSTLSYWIKAYKEVKLVDIGKMQKPLTETEMELAKVKKENAELRMERDILKKQPRTLPGGRCPVCGNETNAALLSHSPSERDAQGFLQWFLCLE